MTAEVAAVAAAAAAKQQQQLNHHNISSHPAVTRHGATPHHTN
jgi:hypothetical protein